jgi:inositol-polyphosphate multikinase
MYLELCYIHTHNDHFVIDSVCFFYLDSLKKFDILSLDTGTFSLILGQVKDNMLLFIHSQIRLAHAFMSNVLQVLLVSSSFSWIIIVWTLNILRKRARLLSKRITDHGRCLQSPGPLIQVHSLDSQENFLVSEGRHRASMLMDGDRFLRLSPMENQVGGFGVKKSPMIAMMPNYILKPMVTKENRGFREVIFYELMQISSLPRNEWSVKLKRLVYPTRKVFLLDQLAHGIFWRDPIVAKSKQSVQESWRIIKRELEFLRHLIEFTAPYYGMIDATAIHSDIFLTETRYLVLQDITSTFQRPCILDIKVGTQTFEPDCKIEKKEKEWKKYGIYQQTFGIRIVGMRKYDPLHPDADHIGFRYWNKDFGRSLTTRMDLEYALKTYFLCQDDISSIRLDVISRIESQVSELQSLFQSNLSFAFYSSSILLVYDGILGRNNVAVRMIDFCHVRREPGRGDEGYQFGLQTLSSLLRDLQMDPQQTLGKETNR